MEQANQLVMEARTAPAKSAERADSIRSILFHVHDDEGLESRLQSALSMARACSAHLKLLQVIPVEAYTVTDVYGGAFVSGEIVEALQEEADKLRLRIEEHLRKEDVSWNFECVTSAIVPELLQNAAFSDLIFIGRQPNFHEFSRTGLSLLGELVCSARTPICIPGEGAKTFDPFGRAVVAWNGSIEAANTVRETIALLKMSADVRIVRFTENKETLLGDTDLLEYLSRHDVHAQLETHLPGSDASSALVDFGRRLGAEYLVMGGYSHSRAGEFLFGGVTRELLGACDISLVMGH